MKAEQPVNGQEQESKECKVQSEKCAEGLEASTSAKAERPVGNGAGGVGTGTNGKMVWTPSGFGVEEVEPWREAVDGKALLDELKGRLSRFVVLPAWGAEALALWILHTYGR